MAAHGALIDDLSRLAADGGDDDRARAVIQGWITENDASTSSLTKALDIAFGRFASDTSVDVLLAVIAWLEGSHALWGR